MDFKINILCIIPLSLPPFLSPSLPPLPLSLSPSLSPSLPPSLPPSFSQDEWMVCQRNWLYLESIFSAPDIQRQLPNEAKMFNQVDKAWKEILRSVHKFPNCIKAGHSSRCLRSQHNYNHTHSCMSIIISV